MNQKQKNIIERKTKVSIQTENKKTNKTAGSRKIHRTLWCQFYESFQIAKIILFFKISEIQNFKISKNLKF